MSRKRDLSEAVRTKLTKDLQKSVANNREEEAEILIDRGANIHDMTLVLACEKGYVSMASMLVRKGANVHSDEGKAFIQACKFSHAPVAELLWKFGNMNTYAAGWLTRLAETDADPDHRIVEMILRKHRGSIEARCARIAEARIHLLTYDTFRPNKKYDTALEAITKTANSSRLFTETYEDAAQDDERKAPDVLPMPENTMEMVKSLAILVKQMRQDRRAHAEGIAGMVHQILVLYDNNLSCYHKITRKKTCNFKKPKMKEALVIQLKTVHNMVSKVVNLVLKLCVPLADR